MSTTVSLPRQRKVLITVRTTVSSLLFACLLPREWERGKEWVFQYSWAGSLSRPETGCQDGPAGKGNSCQCHDPTTTRGCYFPPLVDSSSWLCGGESAVPLGSSPQRCLATLGAALVGPDSAYQLCSFLLLGPRSMQRPVRGASKIMEDSLQQGFGPPLDTLCHLSITDNWLT